MIGLPKTTEFNKRIPKQKFYEKINISPALKKDFVEQIKMISWCNKIASTTTNLAEGKEVTEIEVFKIQLTSTEINEAVLYQIDKIVQYHILFLLEYNEMYQAWISFKELGINNSKTTKVEKYYHTKWFVENDLPLKLEGLNMDAAYENFVEQIRNNSESEIKNDNWSKNLTLKENIELDKKRNKLQKQITALENKMRQEKQLNRQMEMNAELNRLRKEMKELNGRKNAYSD